MLNQIFACTLLMMTAVVAETPTPWSPDGYPDAEGFETRKQIVLEGLATGGLEKWRRGYFAGGDPGKYLPGHAMAKLLLNPEDPEPAKYMNDDRSYREQYHFAVVNWARFWPLFGDQILTEETKEKFVQRQKRANYLTPGGTDNHKTMWWTAANVIPHFSGGGSNHKSKEATLAQAKEILRNYVKGLFYAGQGEWDSSTYLMFTVNGLLNIYDFSPDEEARLIAQAGLDYLIASYAVKYMDGTYTAPNQRGFAKGSYRTIADHTGYVWWGGNKELTSEDTTAFRYTLHAITSGWKPGRVLTHLAKKQAEGLPAEQRNSKPNYWHGQAIPPKPGASHESVYIHPRFTMGSLWDQHASQHSRFQVAVSSSEGTAVFTGGHPRKSDHNAKKTGLGYQDGSGRFVQSAQSGPVYLSMVHAPEEEPQAYAFFSFPDRFAETGPKEVAGWKVFDVEGIQVAVRALKGEPERGATEPDKRGRTSPMLKMPGHKTGFVVWVLESDDELEAKLQSVKVDASEFEATGTVSVEVPDVTTISATFNPDPDGDNHGSRAADVEIDGTPVDLKSWDIYDGPFIKQTPGLVKISDGKESFTIDFTGDLPVYSH